MKTSITLLLILGINSTLAGGSGAGNGGNIVICSKEDGTKTYHILDEFDEKGNLVEPDEEIIKMSQWPFDKTDEDEMAFRIAMWSLARANQFTGNLFGQSVLAVEAHKMKSDIFFSGNDLMNIPDMGNVNIPLGCEIKQMAIRIPSRAPFGKQYYIDNEYWSRLNVISKSVLISHEVIFGRAKDLGREDSALSRKFNRVLFTNAFARELIQDLPLLELVAHHQIKSFNTFWCSSPLYESFFRNYKDGGSDHLQQLGSCRPRIWSEKGFPQTREYKTESKIAYPGGLQGTVKPGVYLVDPIFGVPTGSIAAQSGTLINKVSQDGASIEIKANYAEGDFIRFGNKGERATISFLRDGKELPVDVALRSKTKSFECENIYKPEVYIAQDYFADSHCKNYHFIWSRKSSTQGTNVQFEVQAEGAKGYFDPDLYNGQTNGNLINGTIETSNQIEPIEFSEMSLSSYDDLIITLKNPITYEVDRFNKVEVTKFVMNRLTGTIGRRYTNHAEIVSLEPGFGRVKTPCDYFFLSRNSDGELTCYVDNRSYQKMNLTRLLELTPELQALESNVPTDIEVSRFTTDEKTNLMIEFVTPVAFQFVSPELEFTIPSGKKIRLYRPIHDGFDTISKTNSRTGVWSEAPIKIKIFFDPFDHEKSYLSSETLSIRIGFPTQMDPRLSILSGRYVTIEPNDRELLLSREWLSPRAKFRGKEKSIRIKDKSKDRDGFRLLFDDIAGKYPKILKVLRWNKESGSYDRPVH